MQAFDGDSMLVTDYDCKVKCENLEIRLLGIDTPESTQEPWGKEARNFLLSKIQNSKIYIETDIDPKDKYGRTLVYLFYLPEGKDATSDNFKLLNQEILSNGYAELFLIGTNLKYADKLKEAEYLAKSQHLHIWNLENGLTMSPYKYRKSHKRR